MTAAVVIVLVLFGGFTALTVAGQRRQCAATGHHWAQPVTVGRHRPARCRRCGTRGAP